MNVILSQSFFTSLEILARPKSGKFIYDNGEYLVECGRLRKLYESIKGFIFKGSFGIQDRTSSSIIGDRLVTILKQNKHTINKRQLNIIRQIAERASALANIDVNKDHATLKIKLAKRVTKFDEKQNLVEARKSAATDITIVVPNALRASNLPPIVPLPSEEPSEDIDSAQIQKEQNIVEVQVADSKEPAPLVQETISKEEIFSPEVLPTTKTAQAETFEEVLEVQELPSPVIPKEPVQTWDQIATRTVTVAVPNMPLMISDKVTAQTGTHSYEYLTCPAIPLSVVNSVQNYQNILGCESNTPVANLVTEVVLGKIPTLSKPALVGYQVADNSLELNYSLLGGLSISAVTFAFPYSGVGETLAVIIGAASLVHTGIKWNEARNKGITSKNIALLMTPVFSDLNKFINQKTNEALKEGKVDKIDLVRDEFKTILFTKVSYMRDVYLMNGFTTDSVNIILAPFEAALAENIKKIETSQSAPTDTNQ